MKFFLVRIGFVQCGLRKKLRNGRETPNFQPTFHVQYDELDDDMMITVKSIYPSGKPLSFRKTKIYCPLCSTNPKVRRKVRWRCVKIPRGLTAHINLVHAIEPDVERSKEKEEEADVERSKEEKDKSFTDLVRNWYNYTSSNTTKVMERTMPISMVGSFLNYYDGKDWKGYCVELVRAVESFVAKRTSSEEMTGDSYEKSLPPLHAIASCAESDVTRFVECLNATTKENRLNALLSTDRNGSLCLHWAGGCGNRVLVDYIINEIRRHDDRDLSAYHRVVTSKSTRGVDGRNFLHFAARHGRDGLLDHVLENAKDYSPFYVVPHGDKSIADSPGNEGTTLLMLASYGCHLSTVKLLIEKYGANVNSRNKWGCSAAHFVSLCNSRCDTTSVVRYLYQKGADFMSVQSNGHTPAHKASLKGNEHTIKAIYSILNPSERRKLSSLRDNDDNTVSELWSGHDTFRKWLISVGW